MRIVAALAGLILVGLGGWFVGGRLSSDALGMAVGILFGILAGIPAALMVMASQRQAFGSHQRHNAAHSAGHNMVGWQKVNTPSQLPTHSQAGRQPLAQQLPVIVVNAGSPAYSGGQAHPSNYQNGGQHHGREWHDASFEDSAFIEDSAFMDGENSFTNPNEIVMDGQFRFMDEV